MTSLFRSAVRAQMRMWRGAQMWVGLWLMMSALTLLHAGALVNALYDVATAKVRMLNWRCSCCAAGASGA